MDDKTISKKDDLLRKIYFYKEISSEGIDVLEGNFYVEKLKRELIKEGLIKKSSLKNTKKAALKAGASYSIQSYYVTAKGKKYLRSQFPDEFGEKTLEVRKRSNEATERLVKIADTAIMAETAGAYIIDKENVMTEDYDSEAEQELQWEPQTEIIGELISSSAADQIGGIFTEDSNENNYKPADEQLKQLVKENLYRGIFFTAHEAKKNLTLTKKETAQYNFTTITGVLLTPKNPYCLYHAGNGFLSQTKGGEKKIAKILIYNYAKDFNLYPDEFLNREIENAIIFCKNIGAFAKLVLNKYNAKVPPGDTFDNSYIVPVSRHGCNIIKRFIEIPDYKDKLINLLVSEYGYRLREGYNSRALPVENPDGEAVFIGIDFDVRKFRAAIRAVMEDGSPQYQRIAILCYTWQQEYYQEVINLLNTDKLVCAAIDEEAVDELVGFTGRIPAVKERKRRQPTYSRNSLFKKAFDLGNHKDDSDENSLTENSSNEVTAEVKQDEGWNVF